MTKGKLWSSDISYESSTYLRLPRSNPTVTEYRWRPRWQRGRSKGVQQGMPGGEAICPSGAKIARCETHTPTDHRSGGA